MIWGYHYFWKHPYGASFWQFFSFWRGGRVGGDWHFFFASDILSWKWFCFSSDFRHENRSMGVDFQSNQPEASQLWVTVDGIGSKISLRNKGKDAWRWWFNSVKSFPVFVTKSGHGQIMENDRRWASIKRKPGAGMFFKEIKFNTVGKISSKPNKNWYQLRWT